MPQVVDPGHWCSIDMRCHPHIQNGNKAMIAGPVGNKTPHHPRPCSNSAPTRRDPCPITPTDCTRTPDTCGWCNPPKRLVECLHCGYLGTEDGWDRHAMRGCPERDPDNPDPGKRLVTPPRVGQLLDELLDLARFHPSSTEYVLRATDGVYIPITRAGVERLLQRRLDLQIAHEVVTELEKLAALNVAYVRATEGGVRLDAQLALRQDIKLALTVNA